MAWYSDLSRCDYFRRLPDQPLAVGWLAGNKPFPKGPVAPEVVAKLERLAELAPWIFVFRGFHCCELCGPGVDRGLKDSDGRRLPSSSHLNIFVPCDERIYVAPQCLPHYVVQHGYQPPDEFCEAVIRCPEPGTDAFRDLLCEVGGAVFAAELEHWARIHEAIARSKGSSAES